MQFLRANLIGQIACLRPRRRIGPTEEVFYIYSSQYQWISMVYIATRMQVRVQALGFAYWVVGEGERWGRSDTQIYN